MSRLQFFFHHLFLVYHVRDVVLFPPLIPCISCQGYSSFSSSYSLSIMSRMQSFFHHIPCLSGQVCSSFSNTYSLSITSRILIFFHHLFLVYHVKYAVLFPSLIPCLSCQVCSPFFHHMFIVEDTALFPPFVPFLSVREYSPFSPLIPAGLSCQGLSLSMKQLFPCLSCQECSSFSNTCSSMKFFF